MFYPQAHLPCVGLNDEHLHGPALKNWLLLSCSTCANSTYLALEARHPRSATEAEKMQGGSSIFFFLTLKKSSSVLPEVLGLDSYMQEGQRQDIL